MVDVHRFKPARRMAGGFGVNPEPLNPEPVNGYAIENLWKNGYLLCAHQKNPPDLRIDQQT
jgi:hypothetical protein